MSMGYDAALLGTETAAAGGGMLTGLSSVLSPVAAGLGLAGGLGGLMEESDMPDYAYSGAQLYGGSFTPIMGEKSLWIILALLAVVLIFRRR